MLTMGALAQVYPRVYGGNSVMPRTVFQVLGLSPRVRGKLQEKL